MSGRVLVVGDVMADTIVRPEGPLVPGSDRRASIRQMPGGSGANQAVWLAHFGVDVRLLARVGANDHAQLCAHFRAHGVEPLLAADPDAQSGVLVTIVDPDGERSFLTDRGANLALDMGDVPGDAFDDTACLVVSGYSFFAEGPRHVARSLVAEARRRGISVAVDASSAGFLREAGPANFLDWTAGATLLFANEEEGVVLSGAGDADGQFAVLTRVYPEVIVKRGALGAVLGAPGGRRVAAAAAPIDVIDSTGAGDAFAAAFLAARLGGADDEASLRAAVAAGSSAASRIGGQPI